MIIYIVVLLFYILIIISVIKLIKESDGKHSAAK